MKMFLPKQLFVRSFFFFSFFLLLFLSGSLSNTEDSAALLAFKAGLSDSNQKTLSSWVNTKDPCFDSWLGVTCNPVTLRVTRLVLEDLDLTGSFHPLSRLSQLRLLSLKNNSLFSSSSNLNFSSCPNLKLLYLSHNNLAGLFPSGIPHLRRLRRVNLSYNNFSGEIPMTELSQLPHLLTLRLEANSFTGTLDSGGDSSVSSSSSTILEFNVSDNRLYGQIPAWLSHFPASSFSRNEKLCGPPLELTCSNSSTDKKRPSESAGDVGGWKRKRLSIWVVVLVVSIDAVAILAAIATVVCCCYYRKKRRDGSTGTQAGVAKRKGGPGRQTGGGGGVYYYGGGEYRPGEGMVMFEGCKGFGDVDDLLKSSAELLGKGSVGTTYKVAVTEGGDEEMKVVVKRVRGERKKRREVDDWLAVIGGLRHPHIASLRAYCNSKDELLLVYDFLPNGSLHSLLHGDRGPGRTPLDWTTRLRLAAGSARGLAFLHAYNKAKLFHGNLTSSNIIVDHTGNACISDIGLRQLLHTPPSLSNRSYRAPELMPSNNSSSSSSSQRNKYTQKCDVYSFGVILLEILTGKAPTGEGETSLVKWVQRVGRDEWTWEVFDFELVRYKEVEEEMVALMQVGLLCLAAMPRDRPKMSMVHRMIEDIRTRGSGAREDGPNSILNDLSCDSSPSLSGNTTE